MLAAHPMSFVHVLRCWMSSERWYARRLHVFPSDKRSFLIAFSFCARRYCHPGVPFPAKLLRASFVLFCHAYFMTGEL